LIFIIFALLYAGRTFLHMINVFTSPKYVTLYISYFYNALLEYYPLHQAWCEIRSSSSTEKTIDSQKVYSKCPALARTQARKRVGHWSTATSISDCSKPRHTCIRVAVAAHQCYERDSDVIVTSHVK